MPKATHKFVKERAYEIYHYSLRDDGSVDFLVCLKRINDGAPKLATLTIPKEEIVNMQGHVFSQTHGNVRVASSGTFFISLNPDDLKRVQDFARDRKKMEHVSRSFPSEKVDPGCWAGDMPAKVED